MYFSFSIRRVTFTEVEVVGDYATGVNIPRMEIINIPMNVIRNYFWKKGKTFFSNLNEIIRC